jgi:hypothetical protein
MEAICSSETSVDSQRTTLRYIPEDRTVRNHRCENLKSYNTRHNFCGFFYLFAPPAFKGGDNIENIKREQSIKSIISEFET